MRPNVDREWRPRDRWSSTMTHIAGNAGPNDSPILHAAIALAPQIRAASDDSEQGRRLPSSIVAAMKAAGIFGMAMPSAWGGPELARSTDAVPGAGGVGD